jgi:hypothetical protein
MGHPLAALGVAHIIIRSIDHDQPQKNFKYLWLDFGFPILDCQSENSELGAKTF